MKKAENKFERMEKLLAGYSPNTYAAMRVMVRLFFFCHGPPKALVCSAASTAQPRRSCRFSVSPV
jgi:hypothetical protein